MKVKIKKLHEEAIMPEYAKPGDAAMDLYAADHWVDEYGNQVYDTGLAMEIPEGYVGLLFPRSSISKTSYRLRNSVGVIDSGYRGSIMLKFDGTDNYHSSYNAYEVGDRVAQIMVIPHPKVEFIEVEELSNSDRGVGGFGSTGA